MPEIQEFTGVSPANLGNVVRGCQVSGGTPQVVNDPSGTFTVRCTFTDEPAPAAAPELARERAIVAPAAEPRSAVPDDARQAFTAFCLGHVGKPYIWGADGPDAFDCSGLAQVLLGRLGLDPVGDQSAQDLYRHFQDLARGRAVAVADCGCLVFYGRPGKVGHVGVCLDDRTMIEAGGGGPEVTTVQAARALGAEVRVRPITRRSDILAVLRPLGLPWEPPAQPEPTLLVPAMRAPALAAAAKVDDAELRGHLDALRPFVPFILEGAGEHGIEPAVLCGIGSRESGWGTSPLLRPAGPGGAGDWTKRKARTTDPVRPAGLPPDGLGFGRGLLQIDWDAHEFARTGRWRDPRENILYGATVLKGSIKAVRNRHPTLAADDLLFAGLAGYNAGPGRVAKALDPNDVTAVDQLTAHGNYAGDVLARAAWFKAHDVA